MACRVSPCLVLHIPLCLLMSMIRRDIAGINETRTVAWQLFNNGVKRGWMPEKNGFPFARSRERGRGLSGSDGGLFEDSDA
jgi:hypothetical protein